MPIYSYTGIDKEGNTTRATITASNPSAAASAIIAKDLTPLSLTEVEESGASFDDLLKQFGVIRLREITLFLRMMAALIGSGITITEAITVLHEQATNRKLHYILGEVKMHIEGGVSFSDALAMFPSVFPDTTISMIRAGEMGGILEDVLSNLVVYMEKREHLKKMLIRSFIYPSVVLVVAVGVVTFLVVFVIPRFSVLLQGSRLPWNTQFLLDVADFIIGNATTIVASVIGGVAALVVLFVVKESRQVIDRYKIYLPVFGLIFRLGVIVQFSRTLGSLLTSGITLVEALEITKDTLGNEAAKSVLEKATNKVVSGEQFSKSLAESHMFSGLMVSLVGIGEQSGNLDSQVMLVADIYERQLEDRIAWMSSMIEPVLIVGLGGVVGFVAWALVAGMLSMYTM